MSCFVCGGTPAAEFRDRWPTVEVSGLTVHRGCQHDLESAFDGIDRLADRNALVVRWASNNSVPPADLRGLWARLGLISAEQAQASEETYQRELTAFLADYTAKRAQVGYSEEERAEMRAAFGPGETVVDVITGERFEL